MADDTVLGALTDQDYAGGLPDWVQRGQGETLPSYQDPISRKIGEALVGSAADVGRPLIKAWQGGSPSSALEGTAGAMMAVAGPPGARAGGKIAFDATRIGSGMPLYKGTKVLNVDPEALMRAFKSTDRDFYENMSHGRMERLRDYVDKGNTLAMPEVGAYEGSIRFTNGRHRARLAAEEGVPSIPIAVDKGNEKDVQAILDKYSGGEPAQARSASFTAAQYPELAEHPGMVSPRLPTAVERNRVADPDVHYLEASTDAMRLDPKAFEHNVGLVRNYPTIAEKEASAPAPELAEIFRGRLKDNLLWIHDHPDLDPWRERAKLWYDGANRLATDRSLQTGVQRPSVSGVYSRLSPGAHWFENVASADHLMNIHTNMGDFRWTPMMNDKAGELFGGNPDLNALVDKIRGRKLDDLENPAEKALWIRTFHQAYHPGMEHFIVTPEGELSGIRVNLDGAPTKFRWQSTPNLEKAVKIFEADGHMPTISAELGDGHKIRSFHNTIENPNSKLGDVVVDTHQVAGGMLLPLGQKAPYVAQGFGTSVESADRAAGHLNTSNSAKTGASGLYGIHADAVRDAAHERGRLPREMQSIVWEGIRGLMPDVYKKPANSEYVAGLWRGFRRGDRTIDEVRNEIYRHAGGFKAPDWHR